MNKLFTVAVVALCLILSAGFNGIAGANEMKAQDEKMIKVSETKARVNEAAKNNEAVVEEEGTIVDETDIQKDDAEMPAKHKKGYKALK